MLKIVITYLNLYILLASTINLNTLTYREAFCELYPTVAHAITGHK